MSCIPSFRPAKCEIPLVDLRANHAVIADEVNSAMQRVIGNSAFIGGDERRFFEDEFARYCESNHCVGVASGTDALTIILRGLGIGADDEVITTPFSFIAAAEAITLCGAKVVFADINPHTYTLDPVQTARYITYRTRGIIPVHLFGQPADMIGLRKVADGHNLHLIEDAAQAHGAFYQGNRVGSLAHAAAFSFFPGKNLGAYGDGGAVVTSDVNLADFTRKFANHGRLNKHEHEFIGTNSRLDGLQAAILRVKLRYLDLWNAQRRQASLWYRERLQECTSVRLPTETADATSVYHLFVVEVDNRDSVVDGLRRDGIEAGIHYPTPLHLQPAFEFMGLPRGTFPNAERAAERVMSLPMFPEITESQVDRICVTIRKWAKPNPRTKAA